jgi:hypothetical protein
MKSAAARLTAILAGRPGFEPRLTESESAVLPLNYPPSKSPGILGFSGAGFPIELKFSNRAGQSGCLIVPFGSVNASKSLFLTLARCLLQKHDIARRRFTLVHKPAVARHHADAHANVIGNLFSRIGLLPVWWTGS